MYDFRKMTPEMRAEVVALRKAKGLPWHSPPHGKMGYSDRYLVSAACYEHQRYIGLNPERMSECEKGLLSVCEGLGCEVHAWCVLPNHYHLLLKSGAIKSLCHEIGKFHGRSSRQWNQEESRAGRKVWYRCFDREIRSERHFYASLNYVHHNPVHHGYAEKWMDWPWSSASLFLEQIGREEAERIWRTYPILDYGKKWDID
ncbi:MAG: transposase [Acidobacteria bacterium]|nr:transposase [Acidobacteriota bacterium]